MASGVPYAPPLPPLRERPSLAARAADARELVLAHIEAVRKGGSHGIEGLEQAATLLYDPPDGEHVLVIDESGWGIEHPDGCHEVGDPKLDCAIHVDLENWLKLQVEPPLEPGRYAVDYDTQQRKTKVLHLIEDGSDTIPSDGGD